MGKGRRGKAKKKAAARQATEKFVRQLEAEDPSTVAPPARRREPLKLDEFKGKAFLAKNSHGKVDEKKMKARQAVVLAAIEDGRQNAGLTESTELLTHVYDKCGFLRNERGKNVGAALGHYVTAQCAAGDRSGKAPPWWGGITNLAKATKAQLVFVERDGEGKAVAAWSCRKKKVYFPAGSGLKDCRCSVGFAVEKYGEAGATLLAFEESQSALGLLRKFEKQVKKLRSSAQKTKLDAPCPRDVASRFADDVCSTTLPHAGRRRCGKTSRRARRRAVPSRASRAARPRTSARACGAWAAAA